MTANIISGGMIEEVFILDFMSSHPAKLTIAMEKGYLLLRKHGISADIVLGDFDSIGTNYIEKARDEGMEVITFPSEKDYADTCLALEEAIKRGADQINILGATGGRMDHMLANISMLIKAAKEHPDVKVLMYDSGNVIRVRSASFAVKKSEVFGKYISYFPTGDMVTGLNLKGFKYEVSGITLTCDNPIGVSNEITAEEARVSFDTGMLLEIMSKD